MMRQECNRFHQSYQVHQKSTIFLPMLCSRPSIKDVHALQRCNDTSSKSSSTDPLSPRITCIGQVKRNTKVVVYPNPHHHHRLTSTKPNDNNVKYSKLKRFFSGKYQTSGERGHVAATVSIVDLDPPLPVVKRPMDQAQQAQTLWKRRSGGATNLKALQLQTLHHPRHHVQPTTV